MCIQGEPILLLLIKLGITWYHMQLYLWWPKIQFNPKILQVKVSKYINMIWNKSTLKLIVDMNTYTWKTAGTTLGEQIKDK